VLNWEPFSLYAPSQDFIEHCNKQAAIKDPVGTIVDLEYSPNLFIAPIASNTLQPFTTTNLVSIAMHTLIERNLEKKYLLFYLQVVFRGKNSCLVVDPGASQAGRPHMEAVLRHLIPPPMVVVPQSNLFGSLQPLIIMPTSQETFWCFSPTTTKTTVRLLISLTACTPRWSLLPPGYRSMISTALSDNKAKLLCHKQTLDRIETKLETVVVEDQQILISDNGTCTY